jgi:RNA polymerase sigma factor (sigma-70 family)
VISRDSLELYCRDNWDKLFKFYNSVLCNRLNAEDMVQMVMLRLVISSSTIDDTKESFEKYMWIVANNLLKDRHKKLTIETIQLDESLLSERVDEPEEEYRCGNCQRLTQKEKDLIYALENGYSLRDAAQDLGISTSTVRRMAKKIRERKGQTRCLPH